MTALSTFSVLINKTILFTPPTRLLIPPLGTFKCFLPSDY